MPDHRSGGTMTAMTMLDDLRRCHGFTVDTDAGHLGSVLHVYEPRPGELELHVSTPDGVVVIPVSAVRHFDAHEQRIAVVLPVSSAAGPAVS